MASGHDVSCDACGRSAAAEQAAVRARRKARRRLSAALSKGEWPAADTTSDKGAAAADAEALQAEVLAVVVPAEWVYLTWAQAAPKTTPASVGA